MTNLHVAPSINRIIQLAALGLAALSLTLAPLHAADPVTDLAAQLERGDAKLDYQPGPFGYLPSLLKHLGINPASQLLVFSKTSFQSAIINPKNPRAIYFNDTAAVGSVPHGDFYELITLTPTEGLAFYTLSTRQTAKPKLERRGSVCFSCHAQQTNAVPGMMVTSVFPDPDGMPLFVGKFFPPIDHRSPFEDRWGGWYVTGTLGSQRHRGNAVVPDSARPTDLDATATQNVTDLSKKITLANYLAPLSDIVALMTLEHQTTITNFLTQLSPTAGTATDDIAPNAKLDGKLDALADEVVAYMLFAGETPLRQPIQGNSSFAKTFAERGPRDAKGRSLRDFDLKTRMFKYPLSYMVYSDAFDNMRPAARARIYRRLYDALTATAPNPKFAHLSPADRQAILEIVRDTKPNLPEYWK